MGVFIIIVSFIINIVIAVKFAKCAAEKGFSAPYLFLCLFFPVFSWIYVAALPNRVIKSQNEQILSELSKINSTLEKQSNFNERISKITSDFFSSEQTKAENDISKSEKVEISSEKPTEATTSQETVDTTNPATWTCKKCGTENESSVHKCIGCLEFRLASN